MRRLIDAESLKELFPDNGEGSWTYNATAKAYIDAQPTVELEPCGDVVSRNAIIQKLNTMDRYVSAELRLCDTDKKFPQNEVFIVDDVYEEIVEQLPSVHPDVIRCKDCKWYGRADKRRFYRGMDCLKKKNRYHCARQRFLQ